MNKSVENAKIFLKHYAKIAKRMFSPEEVEERISIFIGSYTDYFWKRFGEEEAHNGYKILQEFVDKEILKDLR